MNAQDNALFLLAKRYHKRNEKKGTVNHWYLIRKGPKNKKYICHICNKEICTEAKANPKTSTSEDILNEHGMRHLEEHGLADFI